jgi:hypothetical protein
MTARSAAHTLHGLRRILGHAYDFRRITATLN